jgi:hypothetical protein
MQRGSSLALLKSDFYNDFWPRTIFIGAFASVRALSLNKQRVFPESFRSLSDVAILFFKVDLLNRKF